MSVMVFILVFTITWQIKGVRKTNAVESQISNRVETLQQEYKAELEKNEDLLQQIVELQNDLSKYREQVSENGGATKILKEELKEVKYKNECLKLGQTLKENEEKDRGIPKELTTLSFKECQKELGEISKSDSQKRLDSFTFGLDCDIYGRSFFNYKDLLIKIDPKTGEWLSDFQRQMLLEFVRNNDMYKRYLKEVSSLTSEFDIHDKCRELYEKLYKDYQF